MLLTIKCVVWFMQVGWLSHGHIFCGFFSHVFIDRKNSRGNFKYGIIRHLWIFYKKFKEKVGSDLFPPGD